MDILAYLEQIKLDKVERINKEASRKNSSFFSSSIEEAKSTYQQDYLSYQEEQKNLVKQKEREIKFDDSIFQNELLVRASQAVKEKIVEHLNSLSKDELLNAVVVLLKKEELGKLDKILIRVNSKDYSKYLASLSTLAKGKEVECDKLSSSLKLNKKILLENVNADIQSGFQLVSTDFDLTFDFAQIVESYDLAIENIIKEELFA
jgi:Zn-dependent oligopeptidase